jgi:protein-disulfide isomerase
MRKSALLFLGAVSLMWGSNVEEFNKLPIIQQNQYKVLAVEEYESIFALRIEKQIRTRSGKRTVQQEAFLTKDKKVVIAQVYREIGAMNIDGNLHVPLDFAAHTKSYDIKVGSGKKEYHIFVDPTCPACVRFENMLQSNLDKGTYFIYLYPLGGRGHEESDAMIYDILNQKSNADKWALLQKMGKLSHNDRVYRYGNRKLLPSGYKPSKGTEIFSIDMSSLNGYTKKVALMKQRGTDVGLTGTPFIIDGEFKPIDSYSSIFR